MSKSKKIIPIVSLTAMITFASIYGNSFVFKNRFKVNDFFSSDGIFLDDSLSDNYENNTLDIYRNSFYVPQGLSFSHNYTFVSFYDFSGHNKSIIRVFSHDGEIINNFTLANGSHVGGIACDTKNNLLWVASSFGTIDAYRLFDIVNEDSCIPFYSKLNVGSGLPNYLNPFVNSVAFMTMHNNDLYVGSFSVNKRGTVKKYYVNIDQDEKVTLDYVSSFKVPTLVQGIAFYENEKDTYLILSRSFGQKKSSALQIFKYDENIEDYTLPEINSTTYAFPPMMEQIEILEGNLFALFESESKPYGGYKDDEYTLRIAKMDNLIK